jgi:hypothetical protein
MTGEHDGNYGVAAAHFVLREFVAAVETANAEDVARLVDLIEHTLPDHLYDEEREGGFLDRLAEGGAPHLLLQRLRTEHARFRASLVELRKATDAGAPEALGQLRHLAHDLRGHEEAETAAALEGLDDRAIDDLM